MDESYEMNEWGKKIKIKRDEDNNMLFCMDTPSHHRALHTQKICVSTYNSKHHATFFIMIFTHKHYVADDEGQQTADE